MFRLFLAYFTVTLLGCKAQSQQKVYTFSEAAGKGLSAVTLDARYPSAIHVDADSAFFKTDEEQDAWLVAYSGMLQEFGKFLSKNNFKWDKLTKCFNRVYFNADGTVDYFLYNFLGKQEDRPTEVVEQEFKRLLELFLMEYQLPLSTRGKFAQCSPVTYMPE